MTNSADPDQLASSEANSEIDLDLHCLLRQGMTCLAREGLMIKVLSKVITDFFIIFLGISCESLADFKWICLFYLDFMSLSTVF